MAGPRPQAGPGTVERGDGELEIAVADTVAEAKLTPLVLRNDTLTGWGWAHHDSVARANNIVIKPRGK